MEEIILSILKEGQSAIINRVQEMDLKINRRLIALGFVKNQKILVVKNFKKSKNMLVAVRGCCFTIDYSIADRVFVCSRG